MEALAPCRSLLHRARMAIGEWGGPGVFFSRWLVSPHQYDD
jgi:hypothetical protein